MLLVYLLTICSVFLFVSSFSYRNLRHIRDYYNQDIVERYHSEVFQSNPKFYSIWDSPNLNNNNNRKSGYQTKEKENFWEVTSFRAVDEFKNALSNSVQNVLNPMRDRDLPQERSSTVTQMNIPQRLQGMTNDFLSSAATIVGESQTMLLGRGDTNKSSLTTMIPYNKTEIISTFEVSPTPSVILNKPPYIPNTNYSIIEKKQLENTSHEQQYLKVEGKPPRNNNNKKKNRKKNTTNQNIVRTISQSITKRLFGRFTQNNSKKSRNQDKGGSKVLYDPEFNTSDFRGGIFSRVERVYRRYLLNIWAHTPKKWKNVMSDDVVSAGSSIYLISNPLLQRSTDKMNAVVIDDASRSPIKRIRQFLGRPIRMIDRIRRGGSTDSSRKQEDFSGFSDMELRILQNAPDATGPTLAEGTISVTTSPEQSITGEESRGRTYDDSYEDAEDSSGGSSVGGGVKVVERVVSSILGMGAELGYSFLRTIEPNKLRKKELFLQQRDRNNDMAQRSPGLLRLRTSLASAPSPMGTTDKSTGFVDQTLTFFSAAKAGMPLPENASTPKIEEVFGTIGTVLSFMTPNITFPFEVKLPDFGLMEAISPIWEIWGSNPSEQKQKPLPGEEEKWRNGQSEVLAVEEDIRLLRAGEGSDRTLQYIDEDAASSEDDDDDDEEEEDSDSRFQEFRGRTTSLIRTLVPISSLVLANGGLTPSPSSDSGMGGKRNLIRKISSSLIRALPLVRFIPEVAKISNAVIAPVNSNRNPIGEFMDQDRARDSSLQTTSSSDGLSSPYLQPSVTSAIDSTGKVSSSLDSIVVSVGGKLASGVSDEIVGTPTLLSEVSGSRVTSLATVPSDKLEKLVSPLHTAAGPVIASKSSKLVTPTSPPMSSQSSSSSPLSAPISLSTPQQNSLFQQNTGSDGSVSRSMSLDDSFSVRLGRSAELRMKPTFISKDRVSLPSKADFSLIRSRRINIAIDAAKNINSVSDCKEFLRDIGMKTLFEALLNPSIEYMQRRSDIVRGFSRIIKQSKDRASDVASQSEVMNMFSEFIEAPLRGLKRFQSNVEREKELELQRDSVELIQRMIRSSEEAVEILRKDERLKRALYQTSLQREGEDPNKAKPKIKLDPFKYKKVLDARIRSGETVIVDYPQFKTSEMARISSWGLGGIPWRARTPGQRGIRILSLDGGGTRGVLTVAMLKELLLRVGNPNAHELFDIICGTSTGGIIAALLAILLQDIDEVEGLYDSLIEKIFGKGSNLKLVSEQAYYDENEWEAILYSLCGDQLLIDSNHREETPRYFSVSTRMDANPPLPQIWRNYNFPLGQTPRNQGTFRINTQLAVRATTAAPTYFTKVNLNGGVFCDGAICANNPTAIALQEAKVLYPGVPVELVVSMGTGLYNSKSSSKSMGWDVLANQLIAASVDTEDVHNLLADFLTPDQYYRFNPPLKDNIAIDQKSKTILTDLKRSGKDLFSEMDRNEPKRLDQLVKLLRGSAR